MFKAKIVRYKGNKYIIYCDRTIDLATPDLVKRLFYNFKNCDELYGFYIPEPGERRYIKVPSNSEPLAGITWDNVLVIFDNSVFFNVFDKNLEREYITVTEYAKMHNKSVSLIRRLCKEDRIEGVHFVGGQWRIPKNSAYPERKNKKVKYRED